MTHKSPDLEVISNENRASDGMERRRVPRLNLTSEQFRLAKNGRVFSVADLSVGGMALRLVDRQDLALFPVAARISGVLNLRREKYHVEAVVRHVGRDLVGCEFEPLEGLTKQAIEQFLDPDTLGQELKPIPAEDGALWYHGPSGTDVLLWRRADGQFHRFVLFLFGTFVQWEEDVGVTTGRLRSSFEASEVRGVIRFETMLLDPDEQADPGKLLVAQKLVASSPMQHDLKKWASRHLTLPE